MSLHDVWKYFDLYRDSDSPDFLGAVLREYRKILSERKLVRKKDETVTKGRHAGVQEESESEVPDRKKLTDDEAYMDLMMEARQLRRGHRRYSALGQWCAFLLAS